MSGISVWMKKKENRPITLMLFIVMFFLFVSSISILFNGFTRNNTTTILSLVLTAFIIFLFMPMILITLLINGEKEIWKYREGRIEWEEMGKIARSVWIIPLYLKVRKRFWILMILLFLLEPVIYLILHLSRIRYTGILYLFIALTTWLSWIWCLLSIYASSFFKEQEKEDVQSSNKR